VSLAKSAGLISPNTAGLGQHLVESDHTRPVSESVDSVRTQIGDIAHVIANWHRLPHRRRPWLTVDSLKSLLSKHATK
jgi:predicted HNH restriction endonuclease